MTTHRKIWLLLTSEQRRNAVVLLSLMLIGMVLETLGIGLVIPALALMTQNSLAIRYPTFEPLLSSNVSREQLVISGMLVLAGVYALKALFLSFLAWKQAGFVSKLQIDISQRLFTGYLHQPYTFHLQRNSAQLIRNTIVQVSDVTNVIRQSIMLIGELLVLIGISCLLIAVEPIGALLVVSVLGLAGWSLHRLTRSHLLRWGEARQYHEGLRIQHLQQGLGSAKDVKLLGRENEFLAQYQLHNTGSARVSQRQATLEALPRLWLELLAVIGLVALVFVMIGQGKPIGALLPTLGVFAAAAFRLMPSVNRVLTAIQGVRFTLPVIDTLHDELYLLLDSTEEHKKDKLLSFNDTLTLDQINFQYPVAEAQAINNVSLSIPFGASVGFIGGSGAGKSTLVDIILGLLTPDSGTVKIDDIDIQTNLRCWQDQIGYVPQTIYLTDDTLRRNVAFGLPNDQIDESAVWRAIYAAQLGQFVKDLPQGLDTQVGERGVRLSGGQRQRIGIARALYHDPSTLVLDEATSSLDTVTESSVMEAVRSLHGDKTIIIVAHRLSTVEHCDLLFHLEQGRIVQEGETSVVLSNINIKTGTG